MLFSKIRGLEKVKEALTRRAKGGNIPHAMLFAGKEGAPALPMALAVATYLNCEKPLENDACGVCPACQKNAKFIHPDLHFVFPVASTKKITKKEEVVSHSFLREWRSFLSENVYSTVEDWANYMGTDKQVIITREESRNIVKNLSLKKFEGNYKVMIMWLPEFMHQTAANAILKILEEPPPETVFILVSHQEERLLGTITSRTQRIFIPLFSDEDLMQILHEDYQVDDAQARQLAQLADGNIQEALKLSQQVNNDYQDLFAQWMRECFTRKIDALVARADEFHMLSRIDQRSFLQYALNIIRESLLLNAQANELNRTTGEVLTFVERFSTTMKPEVAERIIPLINEGIQHLERNANAKIMFLDLSINIAYKLR